MRGDSAPSTPFKARSGPTSWNPCRISAERRAVHAQEHQGGSGGHRLRVRRRAGTGVPCGHRRARPRAVRAELPARPARLSLSYGHTHKNQEEVYVVVRGSGRMKLDDEIVELEEWDAVRVPPGTWRGYEAGPAGLEIIVIGAPNLGEAPREDVEGERDWWAD